MKDSPIVDSLTLLPLAEMSDAEIEALLDAAFGKHRRRRTAYRLREGQRPVADCSFALVEEDRLVGAVQSWRVALTGPDGVEPLILLGPIAVSPDRQSQGLGRRLTEAALAAIEAAGETATVLIGDPEYYGRFFGFTAAPTGGWVLPGPVERHRLLVRLTGGRALPAEGSLGPDLREGTPTP